MVGRTIGIGLNSIQKRPARGRCRVRSMAPAGGRPGVQHGTSAVSCCVLGSLLPLGHGCGSTAARDWARQGGANRRRPRACRPWVHGVRSTPTPAGVPGAARKNACLWRTGGQPGRCGTQREQLGKPSEDTSSLEKNIWDGGGSHRRSRSEKWVAIAERRDENVGDARPWRARPRQGKEQLPPALARPCTGPRKHRTLAVRWRGVLAIDRRSRGR